MGYTHHWSLPSRPSPANWSRFTERVRALLAYPALEQHLCWEHDQPDRPPQVDATVVRFNVKGAMGYETFYLPNASARVASGFCKVAFEVSGSFRLYDVAVCAVLIAAHEHLRADVSSDAEWFDAGWGFARVVYAEVTGVAPECPWPMTTRAACALPVKAGGHQWGGRHPCCPKCGEAGIGRADSSRCRKSSVPFEPPPADRTQRFWCPNGTEAARRERAADDAARAPVAIREATGDARC